jgi:pimeloyl-ACP methyl ester carboxylesterase
MTKKRRNADDLRGASRLAVQATKGVTDVVRAMQVNIASGPAVLGRPLEGPVRLFTAPVYAAIKGITHLVGAGLDLTLAQLAPLLGESTPGPEREAMLAVLNGVVGDTLAETGNPLAIAMRLRQRGRALDLEAPSLAKELPNAGPKVLVLVHGSCMSDLQFRWHGHDHGEGLARELGYTPLYVHYNSGLHVSTNGRELAGLLEQAVRSWPVRVEEMTIVAFSMGGLVARSACIAAEAAELSWRTRVTDAIFLGTPHHGAPLERGGHALELLLGLSGYSAPIAGLGKIRSAGVTDLRFGNLVDEDWQARDRFAHGSDSRAVVSLPEGVRCYAIAGSTTPATRTGKLAGDGLVPVDSALGGRRAKALRPPS